jgi:hypothetical protein
MDGVVTFDEARFLLRYPEFATYAAAHPGTLLARFDEVVALYINNTVYSTVRDVNTRAVLINYAIAHILYLDGVTATTGQGSTAGNVGRVSSASEGSVSASLDNGSQPGTAAWWMQSQYGASYWNATASFRTFRYAQAPNRCRHVR